MLQSEANNVIMRISTRKILWQSWVQSLTDAPLHTATLSRISVHIYGTPSVITCTHIRKLQQCELLFS